MKFIRSLLLFILGISSVVSSFAVQSNIPITGLVYTNMDKFDQSFTNFMRKWNTPGASVTVMKDGKILAMRGYGWADVHQQEAVQPSSLFRIASSSKTFTAVTILKLAQDGKLNLNDKVFSILNDITPLDADKKVDPRIYDITVLNLLQMSSGWFSPGSGHLDPLFGPWPPYISERLYPELPASCETMTRLMLNRPLRYKPGTQYVYSNLDYCILGLVINKVTGSPYGYQGYENYVRSNILAPLHIENMRIGSTQLKYRFPNEVHYYLDARGAGPDELKNSSYLPYSTTEILRKNFGNGGWIATSGDLAYFIQALRNKQILNEKYLDIMRAKPAFWGGKNDKRSRYYTIGGIIDNEKSGQYWIQTGSFTGTNAYILTKPNGVTIAVIFNTRPAIYGFLSKFRPELNRLLMNSDVGTVAASSSQ